MKPALLTPRRLRTSALGASFAAAALAAPAFAQDTAAEPTDTAAPQANPYDDRGIIIVTEQRRAQALSDVPVAISAVGAEAMQTSGANDIRQPNQVAPSLLVSSTGPEANGSARIRGVGPGGDNPGLERSEAHPSG